ncbi:hypothetical protein TBLA_0D04790 [Henningerozyma blattae CBS 6284]|uniref:CDP-diacylglycerol--glycerol-3-phosphate 3-phosphatidyltransferase n=1 Tax=Henningerozyma blattae (strain ATCC 34711 / CBS 6284 / DSM 70876 / NBRC 10599 / NRRL Y-10934 / UCD 77-7) TaxID=1071380 RepID=I2H3M3_HENB6|nr:hypothetical protein TBLA_0D04790 [Tetrapisispora blattae CBS 6284]CCH60975.1 hypothetical protein TBLA_0D04790 [Tetrapisispora blattae CBS 6284]
MSNIKTSIALFKSQLSNLNPRFYFRQNEIDIIVNPNEFYALLKDKISKAEERVFLASLYLGKNENELVDSISDALKKNSNLKVYILLDGLRGTREAPKSCSASLLSPLVRDFDNRVDIRFYKTPALTIFKKKLLPKRFIEGIGLQHMKIYGVDNEVILSGANLSSDYFSNRQDRYYLFKSKPFSEYYFKIHQLISSMSYKLMYSNTNASTFKLIWPKTNSINNSMRKHQFLRDSSKILNEFLHSKNFNINDNFSKFELNENEYPTVVYPVSQFTPLFKKNQDYSTEKPSILKMLEGIEKLPKIKWSFTAGYFNMHPDIKTKLLTVPAKHGCIITASPQANGFYKSKGVSSMLPDAYLLLSKKFLKDCHKYGMNDKIQLKEWKKGIVNEPNGWSYHAKGIWLSPDANDNEGDFPFITTIGSSNYTKRAYSLDLETDAIVMTSDPILREKMNQELNNITKNCKDVNLEDFKNDPERNIGLGTRIATKILGGKL